MARAITIHIPKEVAERLNLAAETMKRNHSEIICEALRLYFIQKDFRRIRSGLIPEAKKQGIFTDEDVFREVS